MSIITCKDEEYIKHPVFERLKEFESFYNSLIYGIMGFHTNGTTAILNIDTYMYRSMRGTLESISDILIKGKINDSYSLLRSFYDISIINIYSNLYIQDKYSINNLRVETVNNWLTGKASFTNFSTMIKYIESSKKLEKITNLLKKDDRYIKIRKRCSDHIHYNSYINVIRNAGEVYLPKTKEVLDTFLFDLEAIFIQHFAYIFYLNDHYMMSSDYIDCLECGESPTADSQYWVAPFVQKMFDHIIKTKRPDIAQAMKASTNMQLD